MSSGLDLLRTHLLIKLAYTSSFDMIRTALSSSIDTFVGVPSESVTFFLPSLSISACAAYLALLLKLALSTSHK
jgi:hypothetical protein